jgi:hypothetical protein
LPASMPRASAAVAANVRAVRMRRAYLAIELSSGRAPGCPPIGGRPRQGVPGR